MVMTMLSMVLMDMLSEWKGAKTNQNTKTKFNNSKQQKNQSFQKNSISSRRWNTKSQAGSAIASTVSVSSRFRDRLEKACSTYTTADFKKQVFLLKREIERLEKEILRKDKMIFEIKNNAYENKQAEAELMEAYRVVHFFQGKVKEMELEIQKFRDIIIKASNGEIKQNDLSPLFDELRKQNETLSGQLQEQQYNLYLSDQKYKRLQAKMFDLKRQLATVNRKYHDPTQKNLNQRFDRMFEMLQQQKPLDMKEQLYFHELSQKVKEVQKKNQSYKVEIDVLQNELEDKNIQITLLYKENFGLKKSKNVVSEKSVQKSGHSIPPAPLENRKQLF